MHQGKPRVQFVGRARRDFGDRTAELHRARARACQRLRCRLAKDGRRRCMSEPKTLLQMAGANPTPAKLSEAALVIIDAQNEYVSGKLPLAGVEAALDRLAALLKAARAASAPVIHIVQRGRTGGLFDPDGTGFMIAPQAASLPGETVIEKPLPNAFAKTGLQLAIQATGKNSLVLAGFMTHMCVS